VAKFMVLYNSTVSSADLMANSTPEQMKAGMDAWMAWADKCGDAIVDLGAPVGNGKHIANGGVSDSSSQASGFSVMQGDSIDDITGLLMDHPHFMTPGEPSIDVLAYMEMPGM
jgi:hypothetical protein